MKILIIRPQPGNDASARRARDAGFTPIQLPFFEMRTRSWDAPDPARFDALLITSANAVRHAGAQLNLFRLLPVHSVGGNSAEAVQAAGLNLATTGTDGVTMALENARIAEHRHLLWLAGEDQTEIEVPAGVHIETRIVYAADPVQPGDIARKQTCEADIVALHSARAARHFAAFADCQRLGRGTICLAALSPAIARAAGDGWRGIALADRPDDRALLSAARALVKDHQHTGSQGDKD